MIHLALDQSLAPKHMRFLRARLSRLLGRLMRATGRKGSYAADVVFVSEAAMRELNRRYHGGRGVTDVLSFPSRPPCPPGYLGEVFLYYPRAASQAKAAGHSTPHELEILLTHGLLHLFGYDHATAVTERRMFSLQESICDF
jgi:probable rRNA maturation factor